ncbi:MAG: clostripain-related cysteine peptidase [Elusimicrobia bacterium]|nr:clostripain-related cysteine peptidase [Elusimicrobiota bacterium]
MTRKIIAGAALLSFCLGLSGISRAVGLDFGGAAYILDNSNVPPPTAAKAAHVKAPAVKAVKKWTVMVFLNGKNNLEIAGLYNVNQMEKVGSTNDINIVAELGRMNGQTAGDTHLDGDWTGSKRFFIKKDTDENKITSPIVQQDPKADMGDYKRAVDFVNWAKKNYPAQKYMLILWDHGSGWLDPQQTTKKKTNSKGISFDDETDNYIRTKQIGQILKDAGKVDVLAYDACLMQMAEVAFEVKDKTDVIVGSEEVVPGLGYPYSIFLGYLAKNPGIDAETLGATTVEAFKMFYDAVNTNFASAGKPPMGAQLSAIRSAKLADFGVKVAEFAVLAKDANDVDALKAARAGVMRYDMVGKDSDPQKTISFYGDLYNYAGLLAANLKGTEGPTKAAVLKQKAAELQAFIDNQLIIDSKASGKDRLGRDLADSHGISIYLPPAEVRIPQEKLEGIFEGKYADFEFDKAAKWHDFVTYLYGVPGNPAVAKEVNIKASDVSPANR